MFEAFKVLWREGVPIKLIVATGHPLTKAEELSFRSDSINVEFHFGLSDSELCNLYNSCGVFIYPSLYEGFGISLLEAQVNGLKCFYSKSIPIDAIINIDSEPIDINNFKNQKLIDYININKIGVRYFNFNNKYNIKYTFKTLQKIYQI